MPTVIDHYDRKFEYSPIPDLAKHPEGLNLTEADKKALLQFLKTL